MSQDEGIEFDYPTEIARLERKLAVSRAMSDGNYRAWRASWPLKRENQCLKKRNAALIRILKKWSALEGSLAKLGIELSGFSGDVSSALKSQKNTP